MVKSRSIDRLLRIHAEVDDVEDPLQHSSSNARATRGTGNEERLAILGENGRSHRRKRPLTRSDRVGFALDKAIQVRYAGLRSEVIHFVIEQEAQSRNRDAAAI